MRPISENKSILETLYDRTKAARFLTPTRSECRQCNNITIGSKDCALNAIGLNKAHISIFKA